MTTVKINGKQKTVKISRLTWTRERGPIPPGMDVCHDCDVKDCWEIEHLHLGTRAQNNKEARDRGLWYNWNERKTHCKHGHEFTPENTIVRKSGQRECRICHNRIQREWRKRKYSGIAPEKIGAGR